MEDLAQTSFRIGARIITEGVISLTGPAQSQRIMHKLSFKSTTEALFDQVPNSNFVV